MSSGPANAPEAALSTVRRRAAKILVLGGITLAMLCLLVIWSAWGWKSFLVAMAGTFGGMFWGTGLIALRLHEGNRSDLPERGGE